VKGGFWIHMGSHSSCASAFRWRSGLRFALIPDGNESGCLRVLRADAGDLRIHGNVPTPHDRVHATAMGLLLTTANSRPTRRGGGRDKRLRPRDETLVLTAALSNCRVPKSRGSL
jgi:hypothetical protein